MVKNIIFTNGCFDILHIGHVRLLKYAKSLGKKLIVGLNSDESIKRLKGYDRPVNKLEYRKEVLESIKYVDEVKIFTEDTPYNLIKEIAPNTIVKGGDYNVSEVVGNDLCDIVIFNSVGNISTTNILKKLEK
jgi:rfaE bifunctional protein nucleotidyltransferase chain/domain